MPTDADVANELGEREKWKEESLRVMFSEGLKGAAAGLAVVSAFHFGANALWPRYTKFATGPKFFWLSSVVFGAFDVRSELAHLEVQERRRQMIADAREKADEEFRERRAAGLR